MRQRLPDQRKSITHKLVLRHEKITGKIERLHIYITVGLFDDGRPGELFLNLDDADDCVRGWAKQWAIAISLCLQNGVTLDKIVEKFSNQDFSPNGFTENKELHGCKSIPDYVVRWMEKQFTDNQGNL
jgi:ribonucleoside-diphosphate reductase alpha chain